MRKPVIGITANVITLDNGAERAAASPDYVKAIEMAGGIPILLPVVTDKEIIKRQAQLIDGLLLSGGYDINPLLFGEQPAEKLGYLTPERDLHELELAKIANSIQIPVLGICRGIQIMNVAFGGTIYQDIAELPGVIKHMQKAKNYVPTHAVEIMPNSLLESIVGNHLMVNSFHHQAVKDVALGFNIVGRSLDGVIEAIEKKDGQFFLGVQWHPEMMLSSEPLMLNVFRRFVAATGIGE